MTRKRIAWQLIRSFSLLIAVSLLSFILIVSSPIDPVEAYIGADKAISEKQRQSIIDYWGLDKEPLERFGLWIKNLIHGDMGDSIAYRKPVIQVIRERFSTSLVLMLTTWIISGLSGFVLGVLAGAFEGSLFDKIVKGFCLILASTPAFWIGILVLMLFVVKLGWFPMGMAVPLGTLAEDVTLGDRLYHLILPAFTLSIVSISSITLHTREKLISVLQSEPVLFARARGESREFPFRNDNGYRQSWTEFREARPFLSILSQMEKRGSHLLLRKEFPVLLPSSAFQFPKGLRLSAYASPRYESSLKSIGRL